MSDYWEECIGEALEESGLEATREQVNNIASWIEGAHENYGMAHGHHYIPNPLEVDVKELKGVIKTHPEEIRLIDERHERELKDLHYVINELRWKLREDQS